jgi:hypothetical protein
MPDAEISAAEMVLREEFAGRAKNSLAISYSLPGRFLTLRRVRWVGIFPGNDASIFPLQIRGSFPFDITKHNLAHIMGDLPSKRVY